MPEGLYGTLNEISHTEISNPHVFSRVRNFDGGMLQFGESKSSWWRGTVVERRSLTGEL